MNERRQIKNETFEVHLNEAFELEFTTFKNEVIALIKSYDDKNLKKSMSEIKLECMNLLNKLTNSNIYREYANIGDQETLTLINKLKDIPVTSWIRNLNR